MMLAMMHFLVDDFSLDMPERVVVDASLPDPWNSKISISSGILQLLGYVSRTVELLPCGLLKLQLLFFI
jgi:hypothetical protein